jgi:branched-chain amino acid transport system ATP-binding protein
MRDALLEVQNLNVYYGQAHTLQDVSLQVGREPVALVGRNGMGKTTLCKALLGLVAAKGNVTLAGQSLTGYKPHQIATAGIGYVPQGRRIFPSLSVHEHLVLMGGVKPKDKATPRRWTPERVYELFPRLYERRKNGAANLSGGEQQMLAIGRALLLNAKIIIMDEPSEGLAPIIVEGLVATLKRLSQEEGLGLLVVEQKLSVATALADRLLVMVNGRIAAETTSAELLADSAAQQRYLGVA